MDGHSHVLRAYGPFVTHATATKRGAEREDGLASQRGGMKTRKGSSAASVVFVPRGIEAFCRAQGRCLHREFSVHLAMHRPIHHFPALLSVALTVSLVPRVPITTCTGPGPRTIPRVLRLGRARPRAACTDKSGPQLWRPAGPTARRDPS